MKNNSLIGGIRSLRARNNAMHKIKTLFICLIILTSFSAMVYADTYSYDANGNMKEESKSSGERKCFEYNSANQLKKATNCVGTTIAEYFYDQTGKRIKTIEYTTSGTITTYYPFSELEEQVGGTKAGTTSYVFAGGERIARKDPDNTVHYYHSDHLGSTSLITSSSGAVEEKTKYYPFGATRTGGTTTKYQYTGQEQDTETNLYYYGARYYNPNLMHFTQPDNQIPNVYDPQSLNRYSYVKNNPLKYTDPTGNNPFLLSYLFGSVFGIGEYIITTGNYNLFDVFNSREAQQLSMQRGAEGAAFFAIFEIAGVNALMGKTLGWAGSKVSQSFARNILNTYLQQPIRKTGVTVLGNEGYDLIANELGANYFRIPDNVYSVLKSLNLNRLVNKQFLIDTANRGDKIVFSTPKSAATGEFAWEIGQLKELGYTIYENYAVIIK